MSPALVAKILESKPQPLTERLCRALLRAWNEPAAREADDDTEGRRHEALYAQERQSREKVLVVIDPVGYTEVFGGPTLDCRVVSVNPLDDSDKWLRKLPQCYRDLFMPGFVKANGMPWFVPELDNEAMLKVLQWEARVACHEKLDDILETLRKP